MPKGVFGVGRLKGWTRTSLGFKPTDVSGLLLWLDTSDTSTITEATNLVSQIDDKTSNNNDATQSVEVEKPITNTRTIGGLNALDYDGTDHNLTISGFSANLGKAATFSYFVVFQADVLTSNRTIISSTLAYADRTVTILSSSEIRSGVFDGVSYVGASTAFTDTTGPHLLSVTYDGAGTINQWLDGVASAGTNMPFAKSSANTRIGALTNNSSNFDGIIASVLVYDSVLSTTDRTAVEAYLTAKYSL